MSPRQIDCLLHVGGAKRSLDPSPCRQFPPAFVPPRRRSPGKPSRAHASRPRPATWHLWRPLFLPVGWPLLHPPSRSRSPAAGARPFPSISTRFFSAATVSLPLHPHAPVAPAPCDRDARRSSRAARSELRPHRACTRFVPSLNSAPGSASRTPGR